MSFGFFELIKKTRAWGLDKNFPQIGFHAESVGMTTLALRLPSCHLRELPAYETHRLIFGIQIAFQLGIFDGRENLLKLRPWSISGGDEVISADQRLGVYGFRC